jgi:hypothetical protein
LCRKHHLFKHLTGSDLIQIAPGILGWTTPLGQRHVTRPEPYPNPRELHQAGEKPQVTRS